MKVTVELVQGARGTCALYLNHRLISRPANGALLRHLKDIELDVDAFEDLIAEIREKKHWAKGFEPSSKQLSLFKEKGGQ